MIVTSVDSFDIRFPHVAASSTGPTRMNPDPDYSAAYVVLHTDDGHEGHGFTFTIGRGNDVCRARDRPRSAPLVIGRDLDDLGRVRPPADPRPRKFRWARAGEGGHAPRGGGDHQRPPWDPDRHPQQGCRSGGYLSALRIRNRSSTWSNWRYLRRRRSPPDEALDLLKGLRAGGRGRAGRPPRTGRISGRTRRRPGWLGYDGRQARAARPGRRSTPGTPSSSLKVGAGTSPGRRCARFALTRSVVGPDRAHRRSTPTSAGTSATRSPG